MENYRKNISRRIFWEKFIGAGTTAFNDALDANTRKWRYISLGDLFFIVSIVLLVSMFVYK